MPSTICLDNIKKEPPPYNRSCTDAGCRKVAAAIQQFCTARQLQDGAPVLTYDDNLLGPGQGGFCYCCCACFCYSTLVEKSPGVFVPAQQVRKDDLILAAGLGLQWAPRRVTFDAGFLTGGTIDFVHHLRVEYPQEPSGFREMTVTQDHLFLRADGKLIAVQDIAAGDLLRRADGGQARVLLRVNGSYAGGIRSIELGPFVNGDLTGHLMNSFGIVSADYAVQAAYASGEISAGLVVADADIAPRSAAADRASGEAQALAGFLADPAQWPEGFRPAAGPLVNVPVGARGFFTQAQAEILAGALEFDSPNNTVASAMAEYLFDVAGAFYPGVTCILDWGNDLPNAYTFRQRDQQFIVINGGMARIKVLNRNGMALILACQIAHAQGRYCTGEADYHGVADVMRLMWNAELFAATYLAAVAQLEEIFATLPTGTTLDTCIEPTTKCRLAAYRAGFALAPVPECAAGPRDPFGLRDAVAAADLDTVTLSFTEMVEEITATRRANYKLSGEARVISAAIEPDDPAAVTLGVAGLEAGTSYRVTVTNVQSATGRTLDKDTGTATFTTPADQA